GEFQGVMMDVRIVDVHLAEAGDLVLDARPAEQAESAIVLDVILERQLSAGKQADCHARFSDRGEAARDRPLEVRRDQNVSNLCRARGDEMQAVVTHGYTPLQRSSREQLPGCSSG